MPTPAPTPTPASTLATGASLEAYVEACGFDPPSSALLDDPATATWSAVAQSMEEVVSYYERLAPPAGLQEFHNANLDVFRSLRDAVSARPGSDSIEETFEALDEPLFDPATIEETRRDVITAVYGSGVYEADLAATAAFNALPQKTQASLMGTDLCAGSLFGIPEAPGPGEPTEDDYADNIAGAAPATVGQAIQGAINYGGDVDVFRFTAHAGALYEIDVALGTLYDSVLELLDADGWTVASNDDFGDSFASRIFWEAPSAGDYYAAVEGYSDAGSYTLTISLSTDADDHADTTSAATAITVGQAVQGAIDRPGDVDVFSFTAQVGVLYQIDAALGTLDDSVVELLDANGWTIESNDDYGDSLASRIFWEAPSAGDYYVAVKGYDSVGSYTLTVAVR